MWHFGEYEYYCCGGSECEQRHVFDTYVRDCVSARIRHDVQERTITRCCRWNCQHEVPGASRGALLHPSPLEIEVWGCTIAVQTGIMLVGGLPLFVQSEVSLGVDLEVLRLGARSECKWAAAGQISPASPVAPRHSALAQALWDQHTRVHDQDDEGCNVRGPTTGMWSHICLRVCASACLSVYMACLQVSVYVCLALRGLTLVLHDFRYPANLKKLMLQTEDSIVCVVLPDLKPLPSLLCDVSDMATGVCVCGRVGENE